MKVAIIYSSTTGNTEKVAGYLNEYFISRNCRVSYVRAAEVLMHHGLPDADIYILAFWCRRSALDYLSEKILELLKDKQVIAVGTIGGDAAGDYGRRVEHTVEQIISKYNHCLGVMVCQGAVDMRKMELRRALSQDNPHYVSQEKYMRHLGNVGRPDMTDLEQVRMAVETFIM